MSVSIVKRILRISRAGLSSGERERDDFTGGQAETEDEQGNHYPYYGDFGQMKLIREELVSMRKELDYLT